MHEGSVLSLLQFPSKPAADRTCKGQPELRHVCACCRENLLSALIESKEWSCTPQSHGKLLLLLCPVISSQEYHLTQRMLSCAFNGVIKSPARCRLLANLYSGNVYVWSTADQVCGKQMMLLSKYSMLLALSLVTAALACPSFRI